MRSFLQLRLQPFAMIMMTFLLACQQKPTQMITQKKVMPKETSVSSLISDETVILDVRNPFEYSANRIPSSINAQWSDFTSSSPETRGVLQSDLFAVARRLALWGIDPQTPVLVVGKGLDGKGEEGRVAWMLTHLGVKKVNIARYDLFRGRVVSLEENEPLPKNKETWMPSDAGLSELKWPDFVDKLVPHRYNFKFLKPYLVDGKEGNRVGRFLNSTLRFVDVRSPAEFQRFNLQQLDPKFQLTHIEWKRFFLPNGTVRPETFNDLQKMGWGDEDEIILISEDGLSSGAVTFALHQLGFTRAQNFSGGYVQIEYEMGRKAVAKKPKENKSKKKSKK